MSVLHHVTNRHYTHVFPNDHLLDKVQKSFDNFFMIGQEATHISTCLEKAFDREALKSRENCVIFWRELPGWLPVKTEAMVALHYLGQDPTKIPVSDLPPRKAEIARNFMRTCHRADVIFSSNLQYSTLDIRSHLLIPPYSDAYGIPVFGHKEWDVVVYGSLDGNRRKKIIENLSEFGSRLHCFNSNFVEHPSYLKGILDRSNFVYHIQEDPRMSLNPLRILHTTASSAALIYDGEDAWPLDGFEASVIKVSLSGEHTARLIKEQIASSNARCQHFKRQISGYHAGYYMNECVKAFMEREEQ